MTLPAGSSTITVFDGSPGRPVPARLTAQTLNSYSVPRINRDALNVVSGVGVKVALIHRGLVVCRISTTYPVTGAPPSLDGGVQPTVTESPMMLVTLGADGGSGTSLKKVALVNPNVRVTTVVEFYDVFHDRTVIFWCLIYRDLPTSEVTTWKDIFGNTCDTLNLYYEQNNCEIYTYKKNLFLLGMLDIKRYSSSNR